MRRVAYPFPELLSPLAFDISNTDIENAFIGYTASKDHPHIMQVPLALGPTSRFIRAHEATHIAISPQNNSSIPKDIQLPVFEAVEEARVNWVVTQCLGIPPTLKPHATLSISDPLAEPEALVLNAIGTYGRWEHTEHLAAMTPELQAKTYELLAYLHDGADSESYPTLERAFDLCRIIQEAFSQRLSKQPDPKDPLSAFDQDSNSGTTSDPIEALDQAIQAQTNPGAAPSIPPPKPKPLSQKQQLIQNILGEAPKQSLPPEPPTELPPPRPLILPPRSKPSIPEPIKPLEFWAIPKLTEYPMALRSLDPKLGRRRTTYSSEGVIPQAWHRRCTDNAIFTRRVKGKALSILCDVSGSMHLTHEEISDFLQKAPNSIIATYCEHGATAYLSIVAKRGKRCTSQVLTTTPRGGGNGCDGLALRWLAQQPKPRIWISDGYVIPKNYSTTNMHLGARDCLEVCLDSGTKQFLTFEHFLSSLGTKRFDDWSYELPALYLKDYYDLGCPLNRMPPKFRTQGYTT